MRRLFLMLTGFSAAAFVLAQDVPKGPSQLPVGTYETITAPGTAGSAPKAETPNLLQLQPGGDQTLSPATLAPGAVSPGFPLDSEKTGIGISSAAAAPAPQIEQVAATNAEANASKINFLMDTGVQYEDSGEYEDAEKAYQRALEKAPGNADILFRLSTLYIQMKRYKEAVGILEGLSKAYPDNPMIHNNLAWIYASGGEMKNGKLSVRHAREALLSTPYAPSIWNTLAEAYYVSGDYDKALQSSGLAVELLKSQQQKPSDADVASFEAQYAKIQRAAQAGKQLLSPNTAK